MNHERRIWWQDEVDRRVRRSVGSGDWGPIVYWRDIRIDGLEPERKRAIAAGIEHTIEEALVAERERIASELFVMTWPGEDELLTAIAEWLRAGASRSG